MLHISCVLYVGECTCIDPDTTGSTTTEILNTATSDVTTTAVGETTEALPTTIMPSATATSSVIEAEATSVDGIPLPTVVKTVPDITG